MFTHNTWKLLKINNTMSPILTRYERRATFNGGQGWAISLGQQILWCLMGWKIIENRHKIKN